MTLRVDGSEVHVHRDLLCKASPVFEAAFMTSSSFVEGTTQKMDLENSEVSIHTLGRFAQWLYTGDYQLSEANGLAGVREQYLGLADLFVFAEKYVIVDLKNNIIEKLWDFLNVQRKSPGFDVIRRIYDNTPSSSPCRRLLAVEFAWKVSLNWYEGRYAPKFLHYNVDFAVDVAIGLAKRLSGKHQNPLKGDVSDFYETSSTAETKTNKRKMLDDGTGEEVES